MRVDRAWRWVPVVVLMLMLAGCAGGPASSVGTAAPVSDVASVAGKWTGLLEIAGSRDRDDFIELTVDRSGAYRVVASRTIGMMDARGNVAAVSGGKLLFKGERGAEATGTLYTQPTPPERTLLLEGATPSGRRFSTRLRPQP
jgi:hypothetical protein